RHEVILGAIRRRQDALQFLTTFPKDAIICQTPKQKKNRSRFRLFHDDFCLSGSSLRHRVGNATEFARALTILEYPARCGTYVVVPLFGMAVVDATCVAVPVCQPTVARWTEQFRRVCPVCRGLAVEAVGT